MKFFILTFLLFDRIKGDVGMYYGKNGDLFIKVLVEEDDYYKRDGSDIYTACPLTISQAVLGTKVFVKTLSGNMEIEVDRGTKDGDKKKLANLVNIFCLFVYIS